MTTLPSADATGPTDPAAPVRTPRRVWVGGVVAAVAVAGVGFLTVQAATAPSGFASGLVTAGGGVGGPPGGGGFGGPGGQFGGPGPGGFGGPAGQFPGSGPGRGGHLPASGSGGPGSGGPGPGGQLQAPGAQSGGQVPSPLVGGSAISTGVAPGA